MAEQKLNLKILRKTAGLNQAELASRAGVSQSEISVIERGLFTPKPAVAKRIAGALGIDWRKFYPGDEYFTIERSAE